jgi:hypothetical protein
MIRITDKYYINATTHCYILQEKSTIQDQESKNYGKEVFKELGYYTSIEGCLRGLEKAKTRDFISKEQENTMQDLIKEIHKTNELIANMNLKGV